MTDKLSSRRSEEALGEWVFPSHLLSRCLPYTLSPPPNQEPTDQSPKQRKGLIFYYLLEVMRPFASHNLVEHSRYYKEHGGASAIRCHITAKI